MIGIQILTCKMKCTMRYGEGTIEMKERKRSEDIRIESHLLRRRSERQNTVSQSPTLQIVVIKILRLCRHRPTMTTRVLIRVMHRRMPFRLEMPVDRVDFDEALGVGNDRAAIPHYELGTLGAEVERFNVFGDFGAGVLDECLVASG